METVGIRELKSKLSHYLRKVRAGEVVSVTDRGEVVARIVQPKEETGPTPYPDLNRLIHSGEIREAAPDRPKDLYRLDVDLGFEAGEAQAALDEARGER